MVAFDAIITVMFETLEPAPPNPPKTWMVVAFYGFYGLLGACGVVVSFLRHGTSRPLVLICFAVVIAVAVYFFIEARVRPSTQKGFASRSMVLVLLVLLASWLPRPAAKKIPLGILLDDMIRRSTLAEPGGRPFYLKATITDRDDRNSEFNGTVEWYWLSTTRWRRVVKLRDFSQTRIVNGDHIFEDNNGDYFPVNDEMLASEIVDPLPKDAVELVKKLDLTAIEPGTGDGWCPIIQKYFKDTDGQEQRVVFAYDCNTGHLLYLWSPSCCYGVMADYRRFHSKSVAFATQDNPVNIRIDTLRDLGSLDESLFAIYQPSSPAQRITTEKVSETAARKFITQKTDIQWPVSEKPNGDSMSVDIVIGRDGRVKEAWTYSPVNNAFEDAALNAIRKWTFEPQNVNGVPAQIKTTLTIPFAGNVAKASVGRAQGDSR